MSHLYVPSMSPTDGDPDSHPLGQPILKKGRACVNCRRRKMRCDGVQPICGSCYRTSKAEDCEYTNGSEQSTSQKLEREIERLQSRLHRLQTSAQPSPPVALQQPYAPEHFHDLQGPDFKEPPSHIIQRLVDIFLTHASQYGFFLHPGRFRSSVLLSGPHGQGSRPAPSLLSVMYLLGIHLSQDSEMKKHEKTYFDSTLRLLARDTLSTERHPQYRLHVIQTEVLLSYYFFANTRTMEGKYHMSCAFSLGIASGIHRMRTRNPPESTLPPANDDIEEGERVNAMWAIFALDKGWAGVLDCTPNTQRQNMGGTVMVTPLPRETEEYETGRYRCEQRNGLMFDDFLTGTEAREVLSSRALHVKAAFLFERARMFSRMLGTDMPHKYRKECGDSFYQLKNLAMTFKSSIPPFETWLRNPNMDIVRTAYVGNALLDAALIRFYGAAAAQGDEKSQQLRVLSAQEIFNNSINLAVGSWNFGFLNPIIGFAWREAFEVLFNELNTRSAMQPSWSTRHPVSGEDPLRRQLRKGVSSFAIYSRSCAFISHEVEEMTNLLQGIPLATI